MESQKNIYQKKSYIRVPLHSLSFLLQQPEVACRKSIRKDVIYVLGFPPSDQWIKDIQRHR